MLFRSRSFVAVGIDEDMPHAFVLHGPRMAHDVSAWGLYLDDVCAVVAQNLGRIRTQDYASEVDDAQAG